MSSNERCVVISNIEDMKTLETEWNQLWTKANGTYFTTFTCALHSWNEIAAFDKRKLFCIVIWRGRNLELVWPLVRFRKGPCKMIKPLGPGAAETNDILVDPQSDVQRNVRHAWHILTKCCECDIIN